MKTLDKVQIGKTIKEERLFKVLSRKFVTELIAISEATLKSYEEGKRLVKSDAIYKLSQIYDITMGK